MLKMRWSESVTLQFVQLYLKHECLWNPENTGYKARSRREKAYSDISNEFKKWTGKQMSNSEIRLKIKNLRTTYCQEVQKILRKSTPKEIYEPSLIWFHEMDKCLKNIPSGRRIVNNTNTFSDYSEADSSQIWMSKNLLDETDIIKPDPLLSNSDEECQSSKLAGSESKSKDVVDTSLHTVKKTKKKKMKRHKEHYSCNAFNVTEDEFDIYGKFIASQLRSMSLQKTLRVQLAIQTLINEARISESMD